MNRRKYNVLYGVATLLFALVMVIIVSLPTNVYAVTTETSSEVESTAEQPTTGGGPTAEPAPPGPTNDEAETETPTTETPATEEPVTEETEEEETEEETTTEEKKPGDGVEEEPAPEGPTKEETTEVGPTTEEPETGGPTAEKPAIDKEPVTDNEQGIIQNKIDRLLDKLGVREGKTVYFTVNQSACSSWRKNGHGCSKCDVDNIAEAAWFKEIFGDVSTELFPPHAGAGLMETNTGRSCFGFACFAQWYTFAESSDEKLDAECVAVIEFNKADIMKNVKPGDVLRVGNSHSMLVYSVEEDGVVVVDSNWNIGGQLNCVVQKHLISYESSYKGDVTCVYRVVKAAAEPVMEWVQADDGSWYYMDYESGVMTKGWMQSDDSGLWYYLDPEEGYMLYDCWLCDPDTGMWYYLDPDGAMCTSWIVVDNIWYFLDMNGAMCTGWNIIDDKWYLFHISGEMLTGWQEVGGKLYYMTENGDCLMNATTPDGYTVDENGARIEEAVLAGAE